MKFEVRTPGVLDRILGAVQSIARIPQRLGELVGIGSAAVDIGRSMLAELRAYRELRTRTMSVMCVACIERPKDLKPEETWTSPYWYPAPLPACTRCKAPNPLSR